MQEKWSAPIPLFTATLLASACALSASACTERGEPPPPFAPEVHGDTGGPVGAVAEVELDGARLALSELAFLSGDLCTEESPATVVARAAELALLGPETLTTEEVLAVGEHCGLRLTPAAEGASLSLSGFTREGSAIEVRSELRAPVLVLDDGPFEMSPDAGAVLLFLDEVTLFAALDLGAASREADGAILLAPGTNDALLAALEAALPAALSLYRDEDGDGRLSDGERREGALARGVLP